MIKEIEIEEIGKVLITKNRRSKRISIILKPFKEITVNIPYWSTYDQAIKVIYNKKNWILTSKEKIKLIENKATIFTRENLFKTRNHYLTFKKEPVTNPSVKLNNNEILVKYPLEFNITDKEVQNTARMGIIKALKKEAKIYLPERLYYLAKKYGFKYNKLILRNSKTRWGSCSSKNNINLSIHLMRLPDHLIDFVILHELMHTKIKNHSAVFWNTLEKITGDVKKLRNELRTYNITIF